MVLVLNHTICRAISSVTNRSRVRKHWEHLSGAHRIAEARCLHRTGLDLTDSVVVVAEVLAIGYSGRLTCGRTLVEVEVGWKCHTCMVLHPWRADPAMMKRLHMTCL